MRASHLVGFAQILKALLSHYWRHPWQTVFLLVGLSAGVGLWSAVQIINSHARSSYTEADSLLGMQANYWIRSKSGQGVGPEDYIQLRRAGFRQVFPIIEADVSTPDGEQVSIIATDFFALSNDVFSIQTDDIEGGFALDWLRFIQSPYQSWVPEQLAEELGLKPQQRLLLRDGRRLPPTVIQSHQQQGRKVLMDIGAGFELLNMRRFSYLAVGSIEPDRLSRLESLLDNELELVENQQHFDLAQLTESLHTHLSAMSLLSFAVGLFIVFNAVRFSLWYRRETLLNLRLMGVSVPLLACVILLETLVWSIVGSSSGLIIGSYLGQWLLPGMSASLHSLYGATLEPMIALSAETIFKAWSITLLGLLWALAWPMYSQLQHAVLTTNTLTITRLQERRTRRNFAIVALVFGLVAALIYPFMSTAGTGFLGLGLMLFCAAFLLPGLLGLGLLLTQRLIPQRFLIGRWLVSDGWSQMPAFRSAMMALLLAMTANLGVGTLIDSFRSAFIGWLEIRQSADIYVRAPQLDLNTMLNAESSTLWLRDSHQRNGVTTRWHGRPTLIRGADTRAPDSLQLPLAQWIGDSPEFALRQWREHSNAILANEQLHYLGGVQLGQTVQLETDDGLQDYRVVGFFYDYGNPYFQFYLSADEVAARWRHPYSRGAALWLKPDVDGGKTALELAQASLHAAGARAGDWILQDNVRRLSINIFDRTFAITSAMNALTLIVAAIALLASLLAILQERMPQFAQWRALGVRYREQLMVIACPLMIFAVITWLLAIPLGALLSWLLIHQLNIVSFGWSMPMRWEIVPAWQLGGLVLMIVVFTLTLLLAQLRRRLPLALAQLGEST